MIVARPGSPENVQQLVQHYNKGSFGPQEKVALGLIGFGALVTMNATTLAHTVLKIPLAIIAGGTDLTGLVLLFVAPIRRRKKYAKCLKSDWIVEIPNQVWGRYTAICEAKGVKADAQDFSENLALLSALVIPAHTRSLEASEEQVVHLHRYIDEKLATIADGSAAPLPHRADPAGELEALKLEYPLDEDSEDPRNLR